jgi:hypothetical protein
MPTGPKAIKQTRRGREIARRVRLNQTGSFSQTLGTAPGTSRLTNQAGPFP